MTIDNKKSFMNALWDWGFLNGSFSPTKCRVSDIDGVISRKGQVLFIEAKGTGKQIPKGQWLTFEDLTKAGFTVLIIWGDTNKPYESQVWYPHKKEPRPKTKSDEAHIRDIVRRWFLWANSSPSNGAG